MLVHDGDGRVHGDIGVLDEAALHVLLLGKLSSLRSHDLDDIRLGGLRLHALGLALSSASSLGVSLSLDVSASLLGFHAFSHRAVLTPATRLGCFGARQLAFVSGRAPGLSVKYLGVDHLAASLVIDSFNGAHTFVNTTTVLSSGALVAEISTARRVASGLGVLLSSGFDAARFLNVPV